MSNNDISIRLTTAFGQDTWDLELPITVTTYQLVQKLIGLADIGLPKTGADGSAIDYQLLWKEGERVLGTTETLDSAGVKDGDSLVV